MHILSSRKHDSGMTLVEMIVVMAIFGVVMMAVLSFYIPTYQSTVTQSQVSDVQENLRLALERMTKDLLMAGFLVENLETTPAIVNNDASSFTIQTKLVGDGFARVQSVAGSILTLTNAQMTSSFVASNNSAEASKIRIFDPLTAREVDSYAGDNSTAPSAASHAELYSVQLVAGNTMTINPVPANPIIAEAVVIRVVTKGDPAVAASPPPVQTIRYQYNAGTLLRIVNGNQQILARGLSGVNFSYLVTDGRITRVDITLTGKTKALDPNKPNDLLSGEKTKTLRSSVTLRNV